MSWSNLDDTSSFTGSFLSTSSTSTVPGPGAITGRFLKAVGEKSLDLVVSMIIRTHLRSIQRTVEKNPDVFRNPNGDKEWEQVIGAYKDLRELCRESRSQYYPLSLQRAAANLIRDITLITRPVSDSSASQNNGKWEELLAHVRHREELLSQPQVIAGSSNDRNLVSARSASAESPNEGDSINVDVKIETNYTSELTAVDNHNWRTSIFPGRFSKSRKSEMAEYLNSVVIRDLQPAKLRNPIQKVLVLGAGGVGKSTLVKQIQVSMGVPPQGREPYGEIIIDNVMYSMESILSDVNPSDVSKHALELWGQVNAHRYGLHLFPSMLATGRQVLEILWRNPMVRRSAHRSKLGLLSEPGLESAEYFFESTDRIFQPDYQPTHEDFVRCRARTTGIYENKIPYSPLLVIDTGGERSERRKWIHCFSDTTAVVFVVALSDYNQTLDEDRDANRMEESLILFDSIVNTSRLPKSLIILFFNKSDLFREKLENVPLKDYFPDYTGEEFDDACQYFERRFLSLAEDTNRGIIIKYGCAINTVATRETFRSIRNEIILHHERNRGVL